MKEGKDFLKWYKDKVREHDQAPPEKVWENISVRLDVNEVWGRISENLDQKDNIAAGKAKLYYTIFALLLIVLAGGIIGIANFESSRLAELFHPVENARKAPGFESQEKKNEAQVRQEALNLQDYDSLNQSGQNLNRQEEWTNEGINRIAHRNNRSMTPDQPVSQQTLLTENGEQSSDDTAAPGVQIDNSDPFKKAFEKASLPANGNHDISFINRRHPSVSFNQPDMGIIVPGVTGQVQSHSDEHQDEATKERSPIKIGLTASAKNTWLLNKATYSGLEKHTLNTTVPDFGKDLGILLEYGISAKTGLQGEIMILSEMGQKYKEYLNGKYVTREVNLAYYSFNLLFKYKINRRLGESGSDIIIGSYGSALRNAYELINDESVDQEGRILKYDFGAVIGYEFNREVVKNIVFTSGLRFNYGFVNIYKYRMNRTFTGSLALNFGVKYRITRKQP